MELTFKLDADDYADFARYAKERVEKIAHVGQRLVAYAFVSYIFLGMALAAIYYFVSHNRYAMHTGQLYAAGLFLFAWLACCYWYARRRYALLLKHFTAPDGFFQQQQRLITEESELVSAREDSTQTFKWSAITGLSETKRLFLLHLDNAQAICVPRRAFASPQASGEFLGFVRARLSESGR